MLDTMRSYSHPSCSETEMRMPSLFSQKGTLGRVIIRFQLHTR